MGLVSDTIYICTVIFVCVCVCVCVYAQPSNAIPKHPSQYKLPGQNSFIFMRCTNLLTNCYMKMEIVVASGSQIW